MTDPIITRKYPEVEVWNRGTNAWERIGSGGWVIHPEEVVETPPTSPGDTTPPPPPPPPPPTPTTSRNNLVSGDYRPSSDNTGVLPGITRATYSGPTTITTADQTFQNLNFYSYIKVQATGVKFINCSFHGGTNWPTGGTCLVDCRSGSVVANTTTAKPLEGVPYFEDCTFKPQRPNYKTDCVMGSFHAKRCNMSGSTDGCGIYNTSTTKGAATKVEGCWIHDLIFWYPEPNHSDGTHNDCIQIQSGGYIHILGNFLDAATTKGDDRGYPDPDGTAYSGGQLSGNDPTKPTRFTQPNGPHGSTPILVQRNTGVALSNSVVVEKNWLKRGLTGANLKDGTYIFRNNWVYRNSFYLYTSSPSSHYPIRPTSAATGAKITGLYSTNKYTDNGEVLTEANGGIKY